MQQKGWWLLIGSWFRTSLGSSSTVERDATILSPISIMSFWQDSAFSLRCIPRIPKLVRHLLRDFRHKFHPSLGQVALKSPEIISDA
jgi:hypothetical protein